MISQVVVGLIFSWAYNPEFGLSERDLGLVLLRAESQHSRQPDHQVCSIDPPSILGEAKYATYGIIAAGLWPQIAYCMILYLTGSEQRVPRSRSKPGVWTAPRAGRCCWHVILPQLTPGDLHRRIVVTVIGALRSFDMIATMTQGGPYGSTNVLAYYMYDQAVGEGVGRYGYGSVSSRRCCL